MNMKNALYKNRQNNNEKMHQTQYNNNKLHKNTIYNQSIENCLGTSQPLPAWIFCGLIFFLQIAIKCKSTQILCIVIKYFYDVSCVVSEVLYTKYHHRQGPVYL